MPDPSTIGYSGADPAEVYALADELLHQPRPAWWAQAACRGQGTGPWFPTRGDTNTTAATICGRCPVRVDCLEAGRDEPEGIWGGIGPKTRRKLRRHAA